MKRIDIEESKAMVLAELKKQRIMTNTQVKNAFGFSKYKASKICNLLCDDGLIYRKRGNHSAINFIDKTECENHRTIYEQIIEACHKASTLDNILERIGKENTPKNRNWLRGCTNNLVYQKKIKRVSIFGKAAYQKKQNRQVTDKLANDYSDLSMLNTVSELLMLADDALFIEQLATAIDTKSQGWFTGYTKTLPKYHAEISQISPQKPKNKLARVISTVKTKGDQLKLNEHLTYKSPDYFETTSLKKIKSDYQARKAPVPVRSSGEVVPFIGNHRDSQSNAGFFY